MAIGRAISDCEELLDKALETGGIVVEFKSSAARTKMRQRLYGVRAKDRQNSKAIYPDPNHPKHNWSAWDGLVIVYEPDLKMRISRPKLDEITSGIISVIEMGEPKD